MRLVQSPRHSDKLLKVSLAICIAEIGDLKLRVAFDQSVRRVIDCLAGAAQATRRRVVLRQNHARVGIAPCASRGNRTQRGSPYCIGGMLRQRSDLLFVQTS